MRPINRIEVVDAVLTALYDYGYGTDSVRVVNYWDESLPITLSRADASHLIVTRPGSAMVVVCDFGGGGDVLLTLQSEAVGDFRKGDRGRRRDRPGPEGDRRPRR